MTMRDFPQRVASHPGEHAGVRHYRHAPHARHAGPHRGGCEGIADGEAVESEELDSYIAFALSDAAPHMIGSILKIDSGRTIA